MILLKYLWLKIFKTVINKLILKGKKSISLTIIQNLIIQLNKKQLSWKIIICNCLFKIKPILTIKVIVKKFSNILIPNIATYEQELKIATKWLIHGTKQRTEKKNFYKKLTNEILDILYNKKSICITLQKKEQFHETIKKISINRRFKLITKKKKKW